MLYIQCFRQTDFDVRVKVFIKGETTLFKRGHQFGMTVLESGAELIFTYQRPPIWQTFEYSRDLLHGIRYDDEFEDLPSEVVDAEITDGTGISRFLKSTGITMSMLVEAFQEGVDKSRALVTQVNRYAQCSVFPSCIRYYANLQHTDAENVLSEALTLANGTPNSDDELQIHLQYYHGELYLDQGKLDDAEKKFLLVEKAIDQQHTPNTDILHLQLLGSLATLAIRQHRLQQAQSLLEKALGLPIEPHSRGTFQRLVLQSQMGVLNFIQDRMNEARALCESTLVEQEDYLGHNHHHTLRTARCLADTLFEQSLVSESKILYQRQLLRLRAILGS